MQLTVKTLKGDKFTINAEESSTIAAVKTIIEQEKSELPAATMKLIHSGKVLKDSQTIAECQLKPNAFLVVMVSKAKKKVEKKPAAVETPAPAPAPKTPAPATAESTPAPAAAVATPAATSSSEPPAPAAATSAVTETPAGAAPTSSTPSAPAPPSNDVSAESVASLTAMGFPEAEVRACLRAAGGNADVAVEFLMNGIPDYAQQTAGAAATPAPSSGGTSSGAGAAPSGEPLAQLRNHPQINQLRTLVQSNPSTLQAVLTQIGQQQPELLQEINGNQELFLQIMNEPVSEDAPAPAPADSFGSGGSGAGGADGAPAGIPEMMAGLGNPAQMAQMMSSMTPEQLQQMAQMMGLTPEQLQQTMQAISRMPPEELQNYMNMAMQGEDGGMGMMGGAGGASNGQTVLRLSEEEMAAVDRLASMGFDRSEAAQAYLACDKNEELAANLLMDGGFGFADDAPGGGGGGAPDGDDMYD
jgi:UV excision repair protein RAD23